MITTCTELSCDLQGCRKIIGYARREIKNVAEVKKAFKYSMQKAANNDGWIVWRDFNNKTLTFCCEQCYKAYREENP